MQEIMYSLRMTPVQFIMNCILLTGLLIAGLGLLITKNRTPKTPSMKKHRVETKAEISRRKQEEDELTSIINESNSDDLYID